MNQVLLIESSGLMFTAGEIPATIMEEVSKTGLMVLKGIPATVLDQKNGNGRTYSEKEIRKSIAKLRKENAFTNRKLHCSADDHPKDSYVQPIKASHIVTDAYVKKVDGKSYLMNDWLVLNTDNGRNLKALVEAKASIGTSIRGLGQLNEETSQVEQYDYLGTDAVGNPSAGTFASPAAFEIQTESISHHLADIITEQLQESTNMFDLLKTIDQFKSKHFKDGKPVNPGGREITEALLNIQREAIQTQVRDQSPLDLLKDEIYGTASYTPPPVVQNDYTNDKDRDALNKAMRELEATKNLASHYHQLSERLEVEQKDYERKIEAFEDVSTTIYEQLQEAVGKLNDGSTVKESRLVTERALRTVRQIQREARELIKGLEIQLENSIRIGDQFAENAIVLRKIVDTLYGQLVEASDADPKDYVSSKGTAVKVDERLRNGNNVNSNVTARQSIKEGRDRAYGPSVTFTGNRQGWV
jgi:hypothetical protein